MLSMSDINHIRDLHQSGYKISEIHKRTGADSKIIRKYLEKEDFSDNPAMAQPKSSILDSFKPTIIQWFEEDCKHWSKQHHTAQRVYDRLVEEQGYAGSYETIQRFLKKVRRSKRCQAPESKNKFSKEIINIAGEQDSSLRCSLNNHTPLHGEQQATI